jgi:ubiquinone/menaquinone biosynthesis C-methylase UbiE
MSDDHFRRIYREQAGSYQSMIAAEDADGHLLPALTSLAAPAGRRIVDVGTGTGRLPALLANESATLVGVDLHDPMLRQNILQRALVDGRWHLAQGDARCLPLPTGWADIVTAGWALGHLRGWYPGDWRQQIGQALHEMARITVSGGTLIIMETMTTGSKTPAPPAEHLAEYYAWLEGTWGFGRQVISTDYVFGSVEEAVALTEFFFGAELAAAIRNNGWAQLPEWTGIWHRRKPLNASLL